MRRIWILLFMGAVTGQALAQNRVGVIETTDGTLYRDGIAAFHGPGRDRARQAGSPS